MAWALITGASSGLGRDFARLAALDGWDLILTARRRDPLDALKAEFARAGRSNQVHIITRDLSEPGAADALWSEAAEGRDIDVLVNNAGLGSHGPLGTQMARERSTLAVNATAYTELMQCALTDFRARDAKGMVINVASVAAFFPSSGMATYHASKAYALSLSDAVHHEAKRDGIKVTALCPGPVDTGFFDAAEIGATNLTETLPVMDSAWVAQAGWRGMKRGRRIVIPGLANKALVLGSRALPRGLSAVLNGFFWNERDR